LRGSGNEKNRIYNALILADLGYAEFLSGNRENAFHYYDRVINIDPGYPKVYHYLGQFYSADGQHDKAKDSYLMAVRLDPTNRAYQEFLSDIRKKLGE